MSKPIARSPRSGPTTPVAKTSLKPWYVLVLVLLALDQITKLWVLETIEKGRVIEIWPFFNLVHVWNPGAAFSFLASETGWQRYFLSAVAVVASIVILVMMRSNRDRRFTLLCLSGILAGAIGNLIDRSLYGAVVDFLDFYYQHYHWPAFNVADVCISMGAIGLLIDELFFRKQPKD